MNMNMNNILKLYDFSLTDVMKYIVDNPQLILIERNPYQADRLMMMLDNEKLAALEQEFNEHPNGIELPNFIWLMKCAISHAPEDKYELVNGLIKLFQDIDINGDGHMEWAEFTQYIIDAVIGSKDTQLYDTRFEKERELTELEVLDRAYSRKSKRYVPMAQADNSNHKNPIKNIQYCEQIDAVLCLEQNSSLIRFYTPDCIEKKTILTPPQDEGRIFIIHFHVVDKLIAAVTSDRQLIFWDNQSFKIIKSFKQDVLMTGIWYLPYHDLWVTAGADYNIRGWDIKMNDREASGKVIKHLDAHMRPITDLVELISPKMLASASHDGKIKLWDLQDQKLITELKTPAPSTRGIRGLSYNQDYGSNLISYGFETYINVWCPEVSITRAYIGKLEGHSTLVVVCKFIPGSPNCVSIDDHTNIRIWDIRQMNSVQVIPNPNDSQQIVTDLCMLTKSDKFVYSGKRLNYFFNAAQQNNSKTKGPNDEIYPIQVEFNIYFNAFVVLTKFDVRIYDAMSGKLKKVMNEVFDDKMQLDLSNICFGGRLRKFFVSDTAGLIRQYNMKTGEFLKKVSRPNEIEQSEFGLKLANIKKRDTLDISAVIFLHEEKLLISASQDSTIRIYDETDPEESVLLKVFCGGHQNSEILSMAYSQHFTMLATGSANGLISLWDFETSKLCGVLYGVEGEVLALDFTDPYPILVAIQTFVVSVWHIKTTKCLLKISTIHQMTALAVFSDKSTAPSRQEAFPEFKAMDFNQKKQQKSTLEETDAMQKDMQTFMTECRINKKRVLLYLGDQKGMMHLLSLTEFLQRKDINEVEKSKKGQTYQLTRKDLIDASKTVEAIITQAQEDKNPRQPVIVSMLSLLVRQWVAHNNTIVRLNKIKEPVSFITSSMDKFFKIWSMKGEVWASINLGRYDSGTNYWKFPFDWVGQKLKDIELVFDALKLIEKENLSYKEKERIKVRFLANKYFNEVNIEELQKLTQSSHVQIPEITYKEKSQRRIQQSTQQQLNIALKPVDEELKELKQKIKDDLLTSQKNTAPLQDFRQQRPLSRPGGLVLKVQQIFNQSKEPAQIEESIQKKKPKLHKRELPTVKPQTSHSVKISNQKFQRINNFITAQVQVRPHTESKKFKFVHDIKYQQGESLRAMKMTAYWNSLKFQSASPQLLCDDNEILQMKCKFYKKMNEDQIDLEADQQLETFEDEEIHNKLKQNDKKIIAGANFLNNATKNKHKALQTKNKIFVV